MISFIHLSDIHFNKHSGDLYDTDHFLRTEIIKDIQYNALANISSFNSILICGDIAYSAQEQEYLRANEFLNQICEIISIDTPDVYCVPGNHDVDRAIAKNSASIDTLQKNLENAKNQNQFDKLYADYSRDDNDAPMLYAPLKSYNNFFASKYSCVICQNNPAPVKQLKINERYTLLIHLINSTLISNHLDNAGEGKERLMRIPLCQMPNAKDNNTIVLTMCHHPPACWNDESRVLQNRLNRKVHIQLYGHQHEQTLSDGPPIIINSGATHPTREDKLLPRYNWITLDIVEKDNKPHLKVLVYPRVLDEEKECEFVNDPSLPHGKSYHEYLLKLSNTSQQLAEQNERLIMQNNTTLIQKTSTSEKQFLPNVSIRKFVYEFLSLPVIRRRNLLNEFSLLADNEASNEHFEIIENIIERIISKNCSNEFWEKMHQRRI